VHWVLNTLTILMPVILINYTTMSFSRKAMTATLMNSVTGNFEYRLSLFLSVAALTKVRSVRVVRKY